MIKEHRLPADILDRIPRLVEILQKNETVKSLIFFGGLAKGNLKPLSDLDFAVLLDEHLNRNELFKFHLDLIGEISAILKTDEFDLIILNEVPARFGYQILKTGQIVFVKDQSQFIDFWEHTVKRYLDFLPYRKSFDSAFLEGMGLHG